MKRQFSPLRALAPRTVAALAAIMFTAGPASACIHTESDYAGTLSAPRQEYAAFWNDGQEVLLISTAITSTNGEPAALSLVTAVPNIPSDITTGDPSIFPELNGWLDPASKGIPEPGSFGDAGTSDGGNGISILPTVEAGPYAVTPIEATGAEGVTELNAWLTSNGFQTLPEALAQRYADEGWIFLAVKITPGSAGDTLADGALPPLQLTFDSDALVVPLKLEAGMGPFAARVYTFAGSSHPGSDYFARYGMKTADVGAKAVDGAAPAKVSALITKLQTASALPTSLAGWTAQAVHSDGLLNEPGRQIAEWADDFAVTYVPTSGGGDTEGADVTSGADVGTTGGSDAVSGADSGSTASSSSSSSDGGCGVTGSAPTSGLALLGAALGLLAVRRRASR